MKEKYIVVADGYILGQFSQLEEAEMFQKITALHSDKGDVIYLYQIKESIEVVK